MQLRSMEVNQLGSADRTEVGLLSPGLNAVCGRRGAGKSSLVRWIRSMIHPANTWNSGTAGGDLCSGRLNLMLGDSEFQLERLEKSGRTAGKVLRRASAAWNGAPASRWESRLDMQPSSIAETLSTLQREALDRLTAIPSDAYACDRLWDVANHLKLDEDTSKPSSDQRAPLEAREQELVLQLQPLEGLTSTREGLLAQRRQLEADLERVRRESGSLRYSVETDEHHRLSDRLSAIERDAEKLRDEIGRIDAELVQIRGGQASSRDPQPGDLQQRSFRERLQAIDAQLARWRNTLSEIRSHRERLESCATDAHLDGQLGEQFSPINQATPRLALRSLEAQIIEARRHFDAMLEGVQSHRTEYDEARNELPQTLRLMQRELHEVCQQLSRHESLTAGRAMKDQTLQLARCEAEMRQAIERLISERGDLLRAIASACHLSVDEVSVAYSDQCRCADHPQLDSWLTAISPGSHGMAHARDPMVSLWRMDELTRLESHRSQLLARLDDTQRDYRETEARLRRLGIVPVPTVRHGRLEADVLRELDHVNEDLLRLEARDRIRVELTDLRRRLQQLPRHHTDSSSLRGRYLRHVAGLTGQATSPLENLYSRASGIATSPYDRTGAYDRPPYDHSNGHASRNGSYGPVESQRDSRLGRLHEVALRLAIGEQLAHRKHPIPVLLDQTLDGLDSPSRLTAARYLASVAQASPVQIVAFTDDEGLAEAVRAVRGNVVPIVVSRTIQRQRPDTALDVNRQLLGFANDFEMEKWNEPIPVVQPLVRQESKRKFLLTERSEVEQVPSIGPVIAARLRALGVDRVADLLAADSNSLADNARLDGVTPELVETWKSEARLLVGMPQLRPFDARILAGAGVRDPRQLSDMHPSRLHERVENFLTTDRGRQIMRSGSSYELSRISSWIGAAKRGESRRTHSREDRTQAPLVMDADSPPGRSRRSAGDRMRRVETDVPTYQIVERDDDRRAFDPDALDRRSRRRSKHSRREPGPRDASLAKADAPSLGRPQQDARWKFYLELASPVVDAPSIGQPIAQRLATLSIYTVGDLVAANAEKLAADLRHSKVTAATVRAWQEQSRLVLRIPNLRGHDAQILVACGVTTPESLGQVKANELLEQALAVARSGQIPRGLRSNQIPDLAEVHDWIRWAAHSRTLMAA